MKSWIITGGLLAAAVAVELAGVRVDRPGNLARAFLGPGARPIAVSGGPAYEHAGRAALFFEARGAHGPIEGAVIIGGERIEQIVVTASREGLARDALRADVLNTRFAGLPAEGPLTVEAITGATISTQAVTDAVNDRLAAWEESRPRE